VTHRLVFGRAVAAGLLAVSAALGAATAQAGPPSGPSISSIVISGVDTAGFPRVTSYVSILGDGGLPASGVSGADLKVFEDGIEVPAADVEAQGDTSQPIGIAFAIDTATTADELTAIKAVVRAMINTFSAKDQGAVIGFGGTAQVAQAATGNAQAVLTALDGVKAGGTFTAMNDGAQAAAREAAAFTAPAARRAVALFTDSGDTSGTASGAAILAAQNAKTPVYAFGYGARNKPDLAELGQKTGGAAYVSAAADGVSGYLQSLSLTLRQGYRVSFRSSVKADGAPHAFVIAARTGTARAESKFVATPGKVAVNILGLNDGRVVSTRVGLSAQASAPAPIISVEYLLDGVSIGRSTTSPFIVDWDASQAAVGSRRLSARVIDAAGNEGSAIINVVVPAPLAVAVSVTSDAPAGQPLRAGGEVRASIALTSPVALRRVDTLVDNKLVSSVEGQTPAMIVIKTADMAAGAHRVTVKATDELGRAADAAAEFQIAPPIIPPINLAVVIGPLLSILAVVASLWMIRQIFASWRRGMARTVALDVANTGNAPARFGLRVIDSRKSSQISILMNNQLLALQDVGALLDGEERTAAAAIARSRPAPAMRRAGASAGVSMRAGAGAAGAPAEAEAAADAEGAKITIDKPSLKGLGEKKDKVFEAVGVGVTITNTISDILIGMSAILPEAIARPLTNAGNSMRQATFAAQRVDDAQAKIDKVAGEAGAYKEQAEAAKKAAAEAAKQAAEMKGKAGAALKQAKADGGGVATATASAPATGRAVAVADEPLAPPQKPARPEDFWVLTPQIAPGDALTLTLRAQPNRAALAAPYALTLESRPIELDAQGVPTTYDNISIVLGARSAIHFWLPWLSAGVIALAVVGLSLFLLNWAGLIRF
jgi:hypothetical protein